MKRRSCHTGRSIQLDMKLLKTVLLLISWTSCWSKNVQIIICPSLTSVNNSNCQYIDAINKTYDVVTNPTFVFMPGIHVLSADVLIENTNAVTIIGSSEMVANMSRALYGYQMKTNTMISFSMSTSIIHCGSQNGLTFRNVTNVSLINITFINCGNVYNGSAVSAIDVENILLQGVTINNSSSIGVFGNNVSGNSTLINSTFVNSPFGLILLNSSVAIMNSKFGNLNNSVLATGSTVQCSSCLFKYNRFGFVADSIFDQPSNSSVISLVDSNFINCNRGVQLNNSVGSFINCKYTANLVAAAIFRSTTGIFRTTFTDGYTPLLLSNAAVMLSNVSIIRNRNSGVVAQSSRLTLTNNVSFNDSNLATRYGGALYLTSSVVYILAPAKVVFFNNTAMIGGAVYVDGQVLSSKKNTAEKCIIQVNDSYGNITAPGVQLAFIRNQAPRGGSDLYANIKTCTLEETPELNYNETDPMKLFKAISTGISYKSKFTPSNSQLQYVPLNVYFCQADDPGYIATNKTISIYPGMSIRVWLASVDVYDNLVPTTLLAKFVKTDEPDTLISVDYFITDRSCQPYSLPDSIVANNYSVSVYFGLDYDTETLGLDVLGAASTSTYTSILKVRPCPAGFTYAGDVCQCLIFLSDRKITCNITDQSFSTVAGTGIRWWLGPRDENSTNLFYSPKCPLEYCNSYLTKLYPSQLSGTRCNFNRSGMLCGKCADGLSETFGEPVCAMCESNNYIAYLALFAALGLVFVLLIFALDLTVSKGTINELIFYANVLNINSTGVFPYVITSNPFVKFLYVFIAWLNLDLGLELCFYNGMDNYQKAWLQFGFSLYLLVIVGIIVIASRHYRLIAALCGRNVIPVIATIVRLSYTKIVKNVFSIFEAANIHNIETGSRDSVWLYDGNVVYMSTPHLILCIFGIIVTVVCIIPYTTFILLSPCLQNKSHWKALCWVQKLIPYIDSYHAPYKDRYRFWTGFLLVIRILLSGVSLSLPDNFEASILIALVVLIIVFTLFLGFRVYKQNHLLILGSFFYINLIFICLMMLFINGNQSDVNSNFIRLLVISFAVGSAFCCFVGILVFHCIKKISKQVGIPMPTRQIEQPKSEVIQLENHTSTKEGDCDLRESLLV